LTRALISREMRLLLRWNRLTSLPLPAERAEEVQDDYVDMADLYRGELGAADGTKLLGYVRWSQGPVHLPAVR